jgi:biopolymer transport protein ExbB/TolQ
MSVLIIVVFIVLILLSIGSVWFTIYLLRKLLGISENISNLFEALEAFTKHIERVNGLETFYGDETLAGLLEHSQETLEEINDFIILYKEGGVDAESYKKERKKEEKH